MALENPEELKAEVLKLRDEGMSSSRIAEILFEKGYPKKSRSAIGGIIARARNKGDPKAKKKERPPAKPRPPKAPDGRRRLRKGSDKSKPLVEKVLITPGEATRVTLMDLRENHCRWPIGDPGTESFRFCGAHKSGRSYCGYHAQIAYIPREDRRR